MPPSKAKGAPPPPRELPPSKAKKTPPEAPPAAAAPIETAATSETKEAADVDKTHADEDTNGAVGNKRRGIRLKQDLD